MDKFIKFDNTDLDAAPEEVPELIVEEPEETGPDYSKLLYEYLSSQDVLSGTRQEEIYAAQTEVFESYESQLQQLNTNFEWCLALLVFIAVLYLHSRVRGWVTMMTGGLKDVH